MFADPQEHLMAELQRLDLLLHRQILRLRAAYQLSMDEFRGLYVSDQQVDSLVRRLGEEDGCTPDVGEMTEQAERMRAAHAARVGDSLPWKRLVSDLALTPFEEDLLLLALAPDLDSKYEALYAYLNNDVTRKWPSYDLALKLFARDAEEGLRLRRHLLPEATLFRAGILHPIAPSSERPSWLAGGFTLAPHVSHFLLGLPCGDPLLEGFVELRRPAYRWEGLPLAPELLGSLRRVPSLLSASDASGVPAVVLEGRYGSGRGEAAEAICRQLGLALLRMDLEGAKASGEPLPRLVQAAVLQQRLHRAALLLRPLEALLDREGQPLPEGLAVVRALSRTRGPVFYACTPGAPWRELLAGVRYIAFRFEDPTYDERLRLWQACGSRAADGLPPEVCEALASRFVLTPGEIRDTLRAASDSRHLRPEAGAEQVFLEAARSQSDRSLGSLAVKVTSTYTWDQLVLPASTLRSVREVAAAIRNRHVVYSTWGYSRRAASGTGIKVLFSGASGTGKTMTASVIARDLGLDLYKVDLSGVVSKYIGETEKNLDRIFRAAHSSSAILFFDEADALFGKRSEVKDAHDRYANIEVAYLLQKMEDHEGPVILASNLSRNIDEAFSRRMHYVVEFPLPDEALREALWRGMFPAEAPLDPDVDFAFLAKQFPIPGGDIRNVSLAAAFLAAENGKTIRMEQIVKAMARQMIKQGKVPSATDFKHYHALIAQGEQP